jgi:hypothetical protein
LNCIATGSSDFGEYATGMTTNELFISHIHGVRFWLLGGVW